MRRRLVWLQGESEPLLRNVFVVGDVTWWATEFGWSPASPSALFLAAMIGDRTELFLSQEINNMEEVRRLSSAAKAVLANIGVSVITAPIQEWEGLGFLEVPFGTSAVVPFLTSGQENSLRQKMQEYGGILSVDIGLTTAGVDAYIAGLVGKSPIGPGTNVAGFNDWVFNSDHFIFENRTAPQPNVFFRNGGISSGFDQEINNIADEEIIAVSTRSGFEGAVLAFYVP